MRKDLHEGESETIALAVENDPEIVFLDESEARRIARVYGLNITGVVGILIRAKREDMIPSLQEDLDRLRDEASLWIGEDVTRRPYDLLRRRETEVAAIVRVGYLRSQTHPWLADDRNGGIEQ